MHSSFAFCTASRHFQQAKDINASPALLNRETRMSQRLDEPSAVTHQNKFHAALFGGT